MLPNTRSTVPPAPGSASLLNGAIAPTPSPPSQVGLLADWVAYHAHLFGMHHLYVIDHKSSNTSLLDDLRRWQTQGLNVIPFQGSFREKHEMLSKVMHSAAASARFVVPLDADEFLAVEHTAGTVITSRKAILGEFDRLVVDGRKYKVATRQAGCPAEGSLAADLHRPALSSHFHNSVRSPMSKTFYNGGTDFISTDQGNHFGALSEPYGTVAGAVAGRFDLRGRH